MRDALKKGTRCANGCLRFTEHGVCSLCRRKMLDHCHYCARKLEQAVPPGTKRRDRTCAKCVPLAEAAYRRQRARRKGNAH